MVDALVLIEPSHAAAYEERTRPAPANNVDPRLPEPADLKKTVLPESPGPAKPTRYFGTAELDPVRASLQFAKIVSELVELFSTKPGTRVGIKLDITASDPAGFDESVVRAARENSTTPGIAPPDFD